MIDVNSAYIGKTPWGPSGGGRDTCFLEEMHRRHIPMPREAFGPAHALDALASFSRLDGALSRLLNAPESDEFGRVRPAPASIKRATNALFPLVQHGFRFPEAVDVGADHDGALRIVWENGPRFLELVVPYEQDAAAYFYYSQGDQYNLQRDLTLDALRERFNWFDGRTR
jgi:hypothetical protein